MKFPLVEISPIWHVGTMDASQKGTDSYEGAGLSVSTEPYAWMGIARLSGNLYRLSKETGIFLNFYEMKPRHKQELYRFGMEHELIAPINLYQLSHYDDEWGCVLYREVTSKEKAYQEREEGERISKRKGFCATEKMKHRVRGQATPIQLLDLLSTIYVEDVLLIDGVWWEEELDRSRLSAPRGVIVPSKVPEWNASIVG